MLTAALLGALAVWLLLPSDAMVARRHGIRLPRRRRPAPPSAPALSALAAELNAGRDPRSALCAVTEAASLWPHAHATAHSGGDITAALREENAFALAACWQIAGTHGAGLARAITALAAFERDASTVRGHLAAELAGPRASARMLATLPVIGVAMGMAMGADPLAFLIGTWPGLLCLAAGAVLTGAGVFWGGRISRGVERLL